MTTATKRASRVFCAFALAASVIFTFACGGAANSSGNGSSFGSGTISLQGAGSTFANPLYQKWISEYGKAHPNVKIDYQSIGSGGGIKQIKEQTIDYGATDSIMSNEDMKSAPGEILHIPVALGAVVLTYNLPDIKQPLRFSPDVVADIFLGNIKKWDDARIKADNPGVNLPSSDISVVHRSDGSGTTGAFTDYLSKVSPDWKSKVGSGTSVQWATGMGGKGNEGVTGQVKQTPNTIGYVELAYAVQNKLPAAIVKNKAGNFVEPTFDSVTAAAAGAIASTPDDLRVSITNADGAQSYPISTYTYILPYKEQKDAAKGKALVGYLWWGIHDGQKYCRDLQYAPLPDEIVKRAEAKINSITSGGKPLHTS